MGNQNSQRKDIPLEVLYMESLLYPFIYLGVNCFCMWYGCVEASLNCFFCMAYLGLLNILTWVICVALLLRALLRICEKPGPSPVWIDHIFFLALAIVDLSAVLTPLPQGFWPRIWQLLALGTTVGAWMNYPFYPPVAPSPKKNVNAPKAT